MLGVTSDWVTCSVRFAPHPKQKIKKEKVALVAVVFINLPKLHPKKNQTCQPQNVAAELLRLNVTRKKRLLQLPNRVNAYSTSV